MSKRGRLALLIALDIIGFGVSIAGLAMIRFSKEEVSSIVGGFVVAGGMAVLAITRFIGK